MKTWKRLLALCLILAMLTSAMPVSAAEKIVEGNLCYTIVSGKARLTGTVEPTDEPIIIPETVAGCPVIRIMSNAFGPEHNAPYVAIPASVDVIERNAFRQSNINVYYIYGDETLCFDGELYGRTIYLHEDAQIEDRIYEKDVKHYFEEYPGDPRTLTPVTEGRFTYALYDGEAILLTCEAEGEVVVPDTLGGCPVTYVAPYCFQGKDYTCTLPETVRSIGREALNYPNDDYKNQIFLTKLPRDLKWLGDSAIEPGKLKDLTMPKGLEKLGFRACAGIQGDKMVIPGALKEIASQAFMGCRIREIVLEEGVESIGDHAFYTSGNLMSFTVPATITQCQPYFLNDSLDTMVYGYKTTPVYDYCVEHGIGFTDLATGEVDFKPYYKEEGWVKYWVSPGSAMVYDLLTGHPEDLVIPETVDGVPVKRVFEGAFAGDTLVSLYLPDTVTELYDFALDGCTKLEYVRLSENLESISNLCFYTSTNLNAIYIPSSVTSIADDICMEPRFLIFAGEAGSYAETYARTHGHPFVTVEEGKEYIFDDGVYRKDPEGAVLLGALTLREDDLRYAYCVVPDEVDGVPVIGIDSGVQFAGKDYGIQSELEVLYLGENVRFIEDGALTDTKINTLYTTPALEELPVPLFADKGEIYGVSGTYAESYAKEHNIFFYPLDGTPFTDVPEESWYFPAVQFCYWNGIMNGTSATTFNPTGISSRAMLVTTLYRLCGEPWQNGYSDYFMDVPEYTWYTAAVDWAAENGVVYGTSATTFSPNDPVTREQVATILYRLGDLLGKDVATYSPLNGFKDANAVSDYAKTALMWAVDTGILQGNDKNMLNPKGATTRAEMATILLRYIAWLEA